MNNLDAFSSRFLFIKFCAALLLMCALPLVAAAQDERSGKQGSIKGKVRTESGAGVAAASVTAQRGEQQIASATTNDKGDFRIDLPAGTYTLVFRKPGLRVGTMQNVEVFAGKSRSLRDRLILPEDEGSLAFVRGSIFDPGGRGVAGAEVELTRVGADGRSRRIGDVKFSDSIGAFAFRVAPDLATYRVIVRRAGAETVTKDVEVDGAMVYRVAVTLNPRREN